MRVSIILDEYRGRPRNMRPSLAGSTLILVVGRNRRPGIFIACRGRLEGGDPGARRNDVRFDPAVFARSTAGEIGHGILPVGVNEEVEPVVFRGAGGDDVFTHGGTVEGLRARSRIP